MSTISSKKESNERICFKLLTEVFITGGYSGLTLGSALNDIPLTDRAHITKLFYGVIEKSIQFDYILRQLTDKAPQKTVVILLKMGLYMLRYMDIPSYAAVDKIVKLSKQVGKSGVSGFINAILRKSADVVLPKDNLSVQLSYPKWVIDRLLKRYQPDFVLSMLLRDESPLKHIRRNSLKISQTEFEKKLSGVQAVGTQNGHVQKDLQKTPLGYMVSAHQVRELRQDEYTFQSLSSMLAVKAYLSSGLGIRSEEKPVAKSNNHAYAISREKIKEMNGCSTIELIGQYKNVLDICSAPGGKAVYLKELCPTAEIVCNDIHPHRVELIKKYAARMGVRLKYSCKDAAAVNVEWLNAFDLVICDVPCSGLGVKAKPDILLNRKESDITLLSSVQYDILSSSAAYVRRGGFLCYSTCTIFIEENEEVVERFLKANDTFELCPIEDENIEQNAGMVNFYPAKYHSDGFFVARLRRKV